jgi:hypothetical protein
MMLPSLALVLPFSTVLPSDGAAPPPLFSSGAVPLSSDAALHFSGATSLSGSAASLSSDTASFSSSAAPLFVAVLLLS